MIADFYIDHILAVAVTGGLILAFVIGVFPRWLDQHFRPRMRLGRHEWGKVYILQDVNSPSLIKVGLTKRTAFIRSREVSVDMTGGRELRRVYVVRLPYAAAVEAEAHRRLARWKHRSERGEEWFRLATPETAVAAVHRASRTVRRIARHRHQWSREADEDATATRGDSTRPLFMVRSLPRREHGRS